VLRSFRDKDTEDIWHRRRSRELDLSDAGPENVEITDYH